MLKITLLPKTQEVQLDCVIFPVEVIPEVIHALSIALAEAARPQDPGVTQIKIMEIDADAPDEET